MTINIDALAREIADIGPRSVYDATPYRERIAATLRRHVTRAPGVELTYEDVCAADQEAAKGDSYRYDMWLLLKRALRARAATPNVGAIGTTIVRKPAATPSAIKTPKECGVSDGVTCMVVFMDGGISTQDSEFLSSTDAFTFREKCVKWIAPSMTTWITRTPATDGRWTDDLLPEMGRAFWYWQQHGYEAGGKRSEHSYELPWFNNYITAWCYVTLPEVSNG